MLDNDVKSLSREALEAEVLRLRDQHDQNRGSAFGRPIRSTLAGRDELLSAVEKTRMPMILTDPNQPDDPIIFANRAFQELSGYSSEELIGRNCRFLQGADTDQTQIQRIRDALRDKRDIALDLLNYKRDGTPFLNELYISPVFGSEGELLYHFGSQVDVTGYRNDRRLVETSERRRRAIFDSITDFAIIVTDREGVVIEWNTGAERVLGWPANAMRGCSAERIFTSEDRAADRIRVEMQGALRNGHATDERWHLRADGRRFWASGEMMPLLGADGEHLGFVKVLRDRTDEHSAGIALEAAQERYRLASKATNDAIWDWDLTTNHVLWNEALEAAYGHALPAVEPTGDWWIAHIHPEDRARIEVSIHAIIDGTGTAWTDEYRFQRADGTYAEVLDRGQVIRDGNGHPCRMIGAMLDLSRVRTAEAALRESEARYRTLFESIDVGFCIVDMKFDDAGRAIDYRIAEANPAFQRQTGADVVGLWVSEFAPDLERHWFDTYGRVALTGEPAHFENHAEVFGRWFDVRALRVGDPAAHRVAIFFSDITARKTMEEELRVLNSSLEQQVEERTQERNRVWEVSRDMLLVSDAAGVWLSVNPAWSRVLGWSAEELVGRTSEWLEHPDDKAKTRAEIGKLAQGATTLAFENRFRTRAGDYRHLSWTAVPEGDRFYCVARDVTDEQEQAKALRQTEEALRQSQKMEAVGQLTGGLAHDFNNLLAGVSGSLELMGTRLSQGRVPDVERYMVAAQGATRRAAALTHRLLAFSRRQTLDPRPTNVNELVSGMTDLIQRTVGPGIQVETVGATGLWPALVDASQLENALLNLCINARDAMPKGGRITIETANKWLDRQAAQSHDMPEGQYLALSVTDTGTGMPPEVIARAFEPFFTTKPIGEGTGLGLSMIYGFAQQSGGQVRIYSEVEQGTTVRIYLPRHYGEAAHNVTDPAKMSVTFAEAGETVLVVDDEPTVRMLVTDVLEELGYKAIEAADSAAGLKVLQSDVRIDLLITDVGLPGGMNGRQMADAGREKRAGLKVLFITGYAENAAIGNGHLAPGMQVLTKPFAVDALASRVRDLIAA